MMKLETKLIKTALGLPVLAEDPGHVSQVYKDYGKKIALFSGASVILMDP
jgi:hypothetical protein